MDELSNDGGNNGSLAPPQLSFSNSNANDNESTLGSPVGALNKGQSIKFGNTTGSRWRRRGTLAKGKKRATTKEEGLGKDDIARAFFTCRCRVCLDQVTKGHLFNVEKKVNMQLLVCQKYDFQQLVEWLFGNSEKIKGAQILFPDTVFFEEGKPSFIARNDKECCIVKITQPSKLALPEIR
jgi:hypothetical protein